MESEEKILIEKAKSGCEFSFEKLIENSRGYLYDLGLNKLNLNNYDFNEILQLTYIKAWKNIQSFNRDSKFSTWIFKIFHNTFIDYKRKNKCFSKRIVFINDLIPKEYSEEEFPEFLEMIDNKNRPDLTAKIGNSEKVIKIQINKAKDGLNDIHKKTFELVFDKKMTYAQAAKVMNCKIGTIMSRVFYLKKDMQKKLYPIYRDLQLQKI